MGSQDVKDDSCIQDSSQPGDCTQLDGDLGKAVWYSVTARVLGVCPMPLCHLGKSRNERLSTSGWFVGMSIGDCP